MVHADFRAIIRHVLSAVAAISMLLAVAPAASGWESAGLVRNSEVSVGGYELDLAMDRPIGAIEAARHMRELRAAIGDQQPKDGPVDMGCGGVFSPSDENGRARIERFCDLRQLRWTYQISSQVRAIIVGPVTEYRRASGLPGLPHLPPQRRARRYGVDHVCRVRQDGLTSCGCG
jgi:hypothetical protein